ncbi:hypothetical protein EBQ74_12090 [bacterium]|nr:hypothetical protein [bacterium]
MLSTTLGSNSNATRIRLDTSFQIVQNRQKLQLLGEIFSSLNRTSPPLALFCHSKNIKKRIETNV